MPPTMSASQADMWYWRKLRAERSIERFAPDTPWIAAENAATGVAAHEISPTEFECLVRSGCKPLTAVDILRPLS